MDSYRKYESPIKNCPKCGIKYADPRCHEIAIEGIPRGEFSVPAYMIFTIIGVLILYRGVYLFGMKQIGTPLEVQWVLPTALIIFGIIMIVYGVVEIIAIWSGIKAKKYDALRKESEERLRDKSYVYILQDFGYIIPEKYL